MLEARRLGTLSTQKHALTSRDILGGDELLRNRLGRYEGIIGGRVTGSQNAAVPQATVALTNTIDGRRLETTTNDEGLFEFSFVDVGQYAITVASTGFSVVKVRAVVASGPWET